MTSDAAPPRTLAAALERINQLEEQLALAHRLFHEHSVGNENLSDYLAAHSTTSPSPPYRSVSQGSSPDASSDPLVPPTSSSTAADSAAPSSSGPPPSTENASSNPSKPVPVDIGAFVLRALALRKNLTIGIVDPVEAEAEFDTIVAGSGLSEKQTSQVREWAGLA